MRFNPTYTIHTLRAGGIVVLMSDLHGVGVEHHTETIAHDRAARGPLKVGDKVERDPDGLTRFVRVGDFKPMDKRIAPTVRLTSP